LHHIIIALQGECVIGIIGIIVHEQKAFWNNMCGGKFLVLGCHCTSNLNNFEIWHVEGNKMFSIGEKMCSLGEEVLGGTWNFPPRKRLCSLGLGDIIFENTTFPQGRVLPRETYPRVNPMV
jgi:hypothetical protein